MTARFADLPLFATDAELAAALLGKRAGEFRALALLCEPYGFPKIDPRWGGRYTPAVKRFFDHQYGLVQGAPAAPPGVEKVIPWQRKASSGPASRA